MERHYFHFGGISPIIAQPPIHLKINDQNPLEIAVLLIFQVFYNYVNNPFYVKLPIVL
ncbi:hypothetical protein NC99_03170 [Sunxiuqinia dokdonensis]|uniref:Uncharacterized protein n=1 Tax=Sunxiuqinia dokdonensis TaxID=1409788 RepID=A0A0L8VFF3_9BACT|nr:hypothetical protein NC99_03170 [Sunxiuqinia dokdonensis]